MKTFKLFSLICITGILNLSSCLLTNSINLPINPAKQVNVTRVIDIDSFTGIRAFNSANIRITEGKAFSITATAPEKIVEQIESSTIGDDGVLTLRYKQFYSNTQVDIEINMPRVRYLENVGTGKIVGQNTFKTNNLYLKLVGTGTIDVAVDIAEVSADIIGTGNIILEGSTSKLNGTMKGTGNIYAYNLKAERAGLWSYGTGNMKVSVSSNLECEIAGTGSISYQDTPKIQSSIKGLGELINAN